MKILFLAPEPVFSKPQGTTLRIRGLARELGRRHEVSILAFGDPSEPTPSWLEGYSAVPRRRRSTTARLGAFLTRRPDLLGRALSEAFAETLRGLLRIHRFHAVFVEGMEMTPYLDVIAGGDSRPFIVYDAHNAEHVLQRRAWENDRRRFRSLPAALYSRIQWRWLRELESEVCHRADLIACTSEPDRRALAAVAPGLDAIVVPNGVDTSELSATRPPQGTEGRVVFVGKMDYRPNRDAARWFAEEIFPHIRAERPGARFLVVGRDPTRSMRALGRLPGVLVTGTVDDVHRYFREADVAVAPLRMGGGTRIKILEAMAIGTPSVATTIGVEGLDVEAGRDVVIADTAPEFARAVITLLAEPEKARALGRAGRRLVADRYDWRRLVPTLESALEARV